MLTLIQQTEAAAYNLKATTSSLKTHVNLALTIPQYSKTKMQWADSSGITYFPLRRNEVNGYLNISQPLPTDGSLYIRSGVDNIVDYNVRNRSAEITSQIGLTQPIAAFFGYNNNRLAYKTAKLAYDLALKRLKRQELDLVYNISQSFFTVQSYHEGMNIARLSLDKQKEAYEIAKSKFSAGLIREVDALQMEVDLGEAENNYDGAIVNYVSQISLFKELLGIELTDSVIIKSDLEYKPVVVDVEKAVSLALENRLELKEMDIQIEQNQMDIKRQKATGRISGNIAVNYQFQGTNKSDLGVPFKTTLENTWENLVDNPNGFGIGLTVKIPIIDWGENRARVRSAQAILKQNQIGLAGEKVDIERDVRSTVSRLQSSLRQLQSLEKSVVVAEKSFGITMQRYSNGDIDSQAMALERERLNNAYIQRLAAYIDYKLRLSDIMRKTFFDFEKNVSLLNI